MTVRKTNDTTNSDSLDDSTTPYKFQMAPICPMLTSNYYKYLIGHRHPDKDLLQAWDVMQGIEDLTACVTSLNKVLNKIKGIPEREEIKIDWSSEVV